MEIDGKKYVLGKMPARTQFHVVRRILPVMANLGPLMAMALSGEEPTEEVKMAMMMGVFPAVAQALAEMKDEDADYVLNACLACVSRQEGSQVAPMMAPNGHTLMFQDVPMPVLLQLTVEVIKQDIGGFFDLALGLLSQKPGQDTKPQ